MEFHHVSVLRNETIDHLIGDLMVYVDCTREAAAIPVYWQSVWPMMPH